MSAWPRSPRARRSRSRSNAAGVIAIELIAAAQGVDYHAPLKTSAEAAGGPRQGPRLVAPPPDRPLLGRRNGRAAGGGAGGGDWRADAAALAATTRLASRDYLASIAAICTVNPADRAAGSIFERASAPSQPQLAGCANALRSGTKNSAAPLSPSPTGMKPAHQLACRSGCAVSPRRRPCALAQVDAPTTRSAQRPLPHGRDAARVTLRDGLVHLSLDRRGRDRRRMRTCGASERTIRRRQVNICLFNGAHARPRPSVKIAALGDALHVARVHRRPAGASCPRRRPRSGSRASPPR